VFQKNNKNEPYSNKYVTPSNVDLWMLCHRIIYFVFQYIMFSLEGTYLSSFMQSVIYEINSRKKIINLKSIVGTLGLLKVSELVKMREALIWSCHIFSGKEAKSQVKDHELTLYHREFVLGFFGFIRIWEGFCLFLCFHIVR